MPAGMEQIMQDPEVMAAMSNPKVMAALQQCMGNPMAMMQYMNDPDVGPVLQKVMGKMMGGGGMPGMGGARQPPHGTRTLAPIVAATPHVFPLLMVELRASMCVRDGRYARDGRHGRYAGDGRHGRRRRRCQRAEEGRRPLGHRGGRLNCGAVDSDAG